MKRTLILIASILIMASSFLAGFLYASQTTEVSQIILHPDIKTASYVYSQIISWDGKYIYDTVAGKMVLLASATYANTDFAVTVNTDFYIGNMSISVVDLPGQKVIRRVLTSTDATPDKDDVQIGADAIQIDSNGKWIQWDSDWSTTF